GTVQRHRIGAVLAKREGELRGDEVERLFPARRAAVDRRVQQPVFGAERLPERGALGAQSPEISRVFGITRKRSVGPDDKPAADATIRTGRADHGGECCRRLDEIADGAGPHPTPPPWPRGRETCSARCKWVGAGTVVCREVMA